MFIQTGTIGIIADDLTGANDTALQFNLSGANTQILFDYAQAPEGALNTQVWAISTETRNAQKDDGCVRGSACVCADGALRGGGRRREADGDPVRGRVPLASPGRGDGRQEHLLDVHDRAGEDGSHRQGAGQTRNRAQRRAHG